MTAPKPNTRAFDGRRTSAAESAPVRTVRIHRIDWTQIVLDLERAGYTYHRIGIECGYEASNDNGRIWVSRLKNIHGTQPKFHHGALLLGLWADVMGVGPEMAPKE